MKSTFRAALAYAPLPWMLLALPATAQTSTVPPSASAGVEEPGVGEIVVTAQKRSQSINEVGLTMTAASSDTLLERGVSDTADLSKIVSGFNSTRGPYASPVYTLRGIGLFESSLGSSPAVAVYVDEIARPFPVSQVGVALDIERVEVLKGPQGTLFGESATGGAINYIAAKPTSTFEAGGDFSYESYSRIEANAYVSGPVTETLGARLAVRAVSGGAWQYSVSRPDDKNGASDQLIGRLLLDWVPSERVTVSLNVNGWRDKSESQQGQFRSNQLNIVASPVAGNPYARVDPAAFAALTTPSSPNFDPSFTGRQALLFARLRGAAFAPGALLYPDDAQQAAAYLGGPNGNGSAVTGVRAAEWSPGFSNRSDNSFYQFAGRIEFDLSDAIRLTSLTSYQSTNIDNNLDTDATTTPAFQTNYYGSLDTFSQELRASGESGGLTYLVGGNYSASNIDSHFNLFAPYVSSSESLPGLRLSQVDAGLEQKIKTYAAFGNIEYKFGQLTALGGIRYTKSEADGSYCNIDPSPGQLLSKLFGNADQVPGFGFYDLQTAFGLSPAGHRVVQPGQCYALDNLVPATSSAYLRPVLARYPQSLHEDNVSWRLGLNYKADQGALLYATVSQGYKAGIIADISPSTTDQYKPARQEKLISYEAGFKLPLADRRVQLNAAAFFYDYSDKQLRARVLDGVFGLLETVVNVPKSRIWGIEAEIVARPMEGLNLSATASYLNSKVTEKFDNVGGRKVYNQQGYSGDFKGSDLPYTPELSFVIDGQYDFPIASNINAFAGGTVTYQSKINTTFYTPSVKANDYFMRERALLDLRVGIEAADGAWRASLYGRNVTNKYYEIGYYNGAETLAAYSGRPATFGVQFSTRVK